MQANNRKDMLIVAFLPPAMRLIRDVLNPTRRVFFHSSFLGLALLLACSLGCAPTPSIGDGSQSPPSSASNELPEITDETLREEINDVYIKEVPEENGAGVPISWRIDEDEPKEFTIVEKQMEGDRATIVLDIKTQTAPGAREPKYLAGQIRTKWELQTGWALRTWEIVETENISLKYKNLTMPPAQNSNR